MPPPKKPTVIAGPVNKLVLGQASQPAPLRLGVLAGLQSALAPPRTSAMPTVTAAVRSAPESWQSALTCEAIGDVPGAVAAWRGGLHADPTMGDAWRRLVKLLNQLGDRAAAAQANASLACLPPEDATRTWPLPPPYDKPKARERELRARLQILAPDIAELTLRDVLRSDPTNAASLRLLAEISISQGRSFAAQHMPERAVDLSPTYEAARDRLARYLLQNGKPGPALAHIEALLARAGCPDPAPIFIVGLPRAGSTLIEQFLASHPEVEGTQELPELGHILHEIRHGRSGGSATEYPTCLDLYDAGDFAEFGARYIARMRIYRKTEKPTSSTRCR
jgi:tetratricopeptide (TPR) repeat protein